MKSRTFSTLLGLGAILGVVACSATSTQEATEESTQQLCNDTTCWECSEVPAEGGTKTHCETACSDADGPEYDCSEGDATCPPAGGGKDKDHPKGAKDGGADDKGKGPYKCKVEGGKRACQSAPSCPTGTHPAPCGACVPDTCDSCDCSGPGESRPGKDGGASTPDGSCTLTQGFWKNHASAWPVSSLSLGGASYGKAELLTLLGTAPKGDASLILAHQLIASLLNTSAGASTAKVGGAIEAAQTWLSAHADADARLPFGGSLDGAAAADATKIASELDTYNNGNLGTPHCD